MGERQVVVGLDNGGTSNNATVLDTSRQFLVDGLLETPSRVKEGPAAAIPALVDAFTNALAGHRHVAAATCSPSASTRRGRRAPTGSSPRRARPTSATPAGRTSTSAAPSRTPLGIPVVYNNDANAAALYAHHVHFGTEAGRRSSVSRHRRHRPRRGGDRRRARCCAGRPAWPANSVTSRSRQRDLLEDDQPMPRVQLRADRRRRELRLADGDRAQPAPLLADALPGSRAGIGRPSRGGARRVRAFAEAWRRDGAAHLQAAGDGARAGCSRSPPTTATRTPTSSAAGCWRRHRTSATGSSSEVSQHTQLRTEQQQASELRHRPLASTPPAPAARPSPPSSPS